MPCTINPMEKRASFSTLLILALLYVFAAGLGSFGSLSSYDREAVGFGAKLGYLLFLILFDFVSPKKGKRMGWLYLPFFLTPFSNLLALLIGGAFAFEFSSLDALRLCSLPLGVFLEEVIFRDLALKGREGRKDKSMWLLISSLLFALCHLASGLSLSSLIQVAYTFGLGLLCGILYLEGGGFWPSFLLHLLFNLFNNEVYRWVYGGISEVVFYAVNIGVAVLAGAYLAFLTLKVIRIRR